MSYFYKYQRYKFLFISSVYSGACSEETLSIGINLQSNLSSYY